MTESCLQFFFLIIVIVLIKDVLVTSFNGFFQEICYRMSCATENIYP